MKKYYVATKQFKEPTRYATIFANSSKEAKSKYSLLIGVRNPEQIIVINDF